ncbi:MAG: universal stress protein [Chloroflexi bacterium]|nr:universal stress protein [Chloroflexota bacterium]
MATSEATAHLRTILVPVDGSHASMQAVALACDIARGNKGKVYVVHVIEVKRNLPLDAQVEPEEAAGEEILSKAQQVSREQGFNVEGEILQAREAGTAIVDEAVNLEADLIIMGTGYQRPFGEFQFGKVVEHVMRNAQCEVWLCRHQVEE